MLLIILLPLIAAIIVGFWGRRLPRGASHLICCSAVGISMVLSFYLLWRVNQGYRFDDDIYTWLDLGFTRLTIGFLIDPLSVLMMAIVTFISFLVHVYTIGYMKDDKGYARFFAYISFFTFAMLMLVSANNFLQMFFGWEGVGLASYLLIGFWYTRESAIKAGMKAFLMNRVGDFGFIIGISLLFATLKTANFSEIFVRIDELQGLTVSLFPDYELPLITTICVALFFGAMGKSAQMPLHVWLPDSMEGPTPISALIHAATMVTAGIFMVARMSPVFEWSDTVLSLIIIIGATTAVFMAILGLVQNDIKRVIAYSTLSQLGYMTVALGVSAYSIALFHLMTHAFFKALLFLAAGSVIIALHHQQDLRKMGGLRRIMPITYITTLIGAWALIGLPPFAGFFSKEPIIEATKYSTLTGHHYAYIALTIGVFLTACYTFRMIFLAFHGQPRFDVHHDRGYQAPKESPLAVTVPLILLAIPSIFAGFLFIKPMLFGNFFDRSLVVASEHHAMVDLTENWHGIGAYFLHIPSTPAFWLALLGVVVAWFFTLRQPQASAVLIRTFTPLYKFLINHFYFDAFYEKIIARGTVAFSRMSTLVVETMGIEGFLVEMPIKIVRWSASLLRHLQTGYLYHYALAMVLGLLLLITRWGMI
ncbi:MAG: NADH-quinone oxidoreductase subunit L [Burkholderiales bacterium]|jgi:NADH-quinone oxidoreductase subunit L|nr:NADH-quinone oxidoreductase subunit L [Burkholderiales bacterium]